MAAVKGILITRRLSRSSRSRIAPAHPLTTGPIHGILYWGILAMWRRYRYRLNGRDASEKVALSLFSVRCGPLLMVCHCPHVLPRHLCKHCLIASRRI